MFSRGSESGLLARDNRLEFPLTFVKQAHHQHNTVTIADKLRKFIIVSTFNFIFKFFLTNQTAATQLICALRLIEKNRRKKLKLRKYFCYQSALTVLLNKSLLRSWNSNLDQTLPQ